MRFRIGAICAALLLAMPVAAQSIFDGPDGEPARIPFAGCQGQNLIEMLSDEDRAALDRAVEGVPYHRGLLWKAERGDASIYLVGTYHFDDLRHLESLEHIAPRLLDAKTLLVEGGPEEQARLQDALMRDPTLIVQQDGPTLRERLDADEWALLSEAMAERGMPGVMVSRMRPWYVSLMLGLSPCMITQAQSGGVNGLDQQLTDIAVIAGIPVVPLEPWDTLFSIFASLTPEDEMDLIRSTLPGAALADDYAVTLADAYFAGDIWYIWEFNRIEAYRQDVLEPDRIDAQLALAQELLMDSRNRNWIAPLTASAETAAGQGGHVVAAFGALHLPGENGVLRLLEREGWTISVWE